MPKRSLLTAAVTAALAVPAWPVVAADLASAPVTASGVAQADAFDGTVEAVRQTVVAAQVPGAVVALTVKAGDRVKAGQVLLRLDARAAEQQAGAAAAQVQAARAAQVAATREYERQKQLFQKNYISQAALDRAEAQYKATQAQSAAQVAAAGAARTESGFYVVKAPYDGVVSDVAVVLGDMAMPGRALVTLHDPAALRVSAALPQTAATRLDANGGAARIDVPGLDAARITPTRWQVLPAVDPATHTVTVRFDLPAGTTVAPGSFARVWLPGASTDGARISVPLAAVVRRAELTAVYVIGSDARPLLRQVRLGPVSGDQVEILSGLRAGERVALDPQAAAKVR
ncbi:MAG: efflux RND transporter periplasmic adaptor subunit [Hydrogenophaga sp.]|nr:efflux RND transporter periplasmic adaptor subunit [Hydrogenophaga sp.]MBX3608727.1 efflux RND transporter periplasmic adaptor subunit [Hydrogenophaga sp.]